MPDIQKKDKQKRQRAFVLKNSLILKKDFVLKSLLGILIVGIFIISGCSLGPNTGSNYQRKYYQGYDSLDLKFLEESPPNIFYYTFNGDNNEIPVVVQVKNLGASDAYGAIYIHGYDPNAIEVAGGKISDGDSGTISWNSGTGELEIGGVYIGLSGGGSRGQAGFGFSAPNGDRYGASVFTENGDFVGLNVHLNIGNNRIGSRLASPVFGALQSTYGWSAPIVLEGDTPETPGGGLEVYEFPSYIYNFPETFDKFQQQIMVTACYSYVTRATIMMCIDPNPNSNAKKACIAKTVSPSGGQGAPVAVTKVEQQASSEKIIFTITIKHTKKNALDDLYDINQLFYKCNPHSGAIVKPSDKNIVEILHVELPGQDITSQCSGGGKVRLDSSGNGQFTCTAYLDSESTHESPLSIELGYGYGKNIYKSITIQKI